MATISRVCSANPILPRFENSSNSSKSSSRLIYQKNGYPKLKVKKRFTGPYAYCSTASSSYMGGMGQGDSSSIGRKSVSLSVPGDDQDQVVEKKDSSQILSAMLPFIVAGTVVFCSCSSSYFHMGIKRVLCPNPGGIMLSIGIKLSIDDFALALKRPLPLSVGFIAQYLLKPVVGILIENACRVPPMFYSGFILTCCVAGAQLSSYASFLSKGDLALSILLTSSTTIASVIVTPLLTRLQHHLSSNDASPNLPYPHPLPKCNSDPDLEPLQTKGIERETQIRPRFLHMKNFFKGWNGFGRFILLIIDMYSKLVLNQDFERKI